MDAMEVVLNTNQYIRKVVGISNAFGPPDSVFRQMLKYNSWILGKPFYSACEVYKLTKSTAFDAAWTDLLDSNIEDTLKTKKHPELLRLLNAIELPTSKETDAGEKRVLLILKKLLNKHCSEFERYSNKTFELKFPDKINLVVELSRTFGTFGGTMPTKNMLISIEVHQNDPNPISVVFHEMLHALFKFNGIKFKTNYIEEAFLDYFTLDGLLEKDLGFIDSFDAEKKHEFNVIHRRYAKAESDALLPLFSKYVIAGAQGSIWKAMKTAGMTDSFLLK